MEPNNRMSIAASDETYNIHVTLQEKKVLETIRSNKNISKVKLKLNDGKILSKIRVNEKVPLSTKKYTLIMNEKTYQDVCFKRANGKDVSITRKYWKFLD